MAATSSTELVVLNVKYRSCTDHVNLEHLITKTVYKQFMRYVVFQTTDQKQLIKALEFIANAELDGDLKTAIQGMISNGPYLIMSRKEANQFPKLLTDEKKSHVIVEENTRLERYVQALLMINEVLLQACIVFN